MSNKEKDESLAPQEQRPPEKASGKSGAQEKARAAGTKPVAETGPQITGDFDADRAMRTIANLRQEIKDLKTTNRQASADNDDAKRLPLANQSLRIVNHALGRGMSEDIPDTA